MRAKVDDTACLPQLTSTLRKAYKNSQLSNRSQHTELLLCQDCKSRSWELCVPNLIPQHGQIARMVSLHKGLVGTQFGKLPTTDWMKLQAGTADCFGGSWEGRKIWSFEIDPLTSSDRSPCREVCFCCDKCTYLANKSHKRFYHHKVKPSIPKKSLRSPNERPSSR